MKMQRRMASLKAMANAKMARQPRRIMVDSIEEDQDHYLEQNERELET